MTSVPDNPAAESAPAPASHRDVIPVWRDRLLDLVGGSALWDVSALGSAAVDLTGAHPSGVAQLFAGRRTVLSNLVREGSALTSARKQMRSVIARTDELTAQYGVAATYVAMGVAIWQPEVDDEEADPSPVPSWRIPVLLRRVHVRPIEGTSEYELELDDGVGVNGVLIEQLADAGVDVLAHDLIELTGQAHGFTPAPALRELQVRGEGLPGFHVESTVVLGPFVHPGQALADDLEAVLSGPVNALVRSLAGEDTDDEALTRPIPAMRLADPDPDHERGVGDLDLSEHRVIDAVAGGASLVVDAPPGVDSAGTVVKVAAWAAAEGKRVLYVPGSRRAAQSVLDAAQTIGVQDLFLDLAHNLHWKRDAAQQIIDSLNPELHEIDGVAVRHLRDELTDARSRLADYIRALHTPREPWQASAYHALQALAALTATRPGPRTQVRLSAETVRELNDSTRDEARELLGHAAELGVFRLRASDTPWYGAALRDGDHASEILSLTHDLNEFFDQLIEHVTVTSAQTGLDEAVTVRQWLQQLDLLDGIALSLDVFVPHIFERSVAPMAAATGTRAWRQQNNIDIPWGQRRHLRKQARDLVRPGVTIGDLHQALLEVTERRELWRSHCAGGGWPRLPDHLAAMQDLAAAVQEGLMQLNPVLEPILAGQDLFDIPLVDLQRRLHRLGDDDAALERLPKRAGAVARLRALGLGELADDLTSRRVADELVLSEFELAWWSSVLEEMLSEDPALVGLESDGLVQTADRVRALDQAHIDTLRLPLLNRVRRRVKHRIDTDRSRSQDFYRAVKGGDGDLAGLQRRYGPIVWQPRPIWAVSPMVIPQVLSPTDRIDLVIVDAAARLPVEHAVPALGRADQAVIVGDTRRATRHSLLRAASGWTTVALSADRIDLDESIAAFLTEHGYAGVTPVVPAPSQSRSLHLHLIEGTGTPTPGRVVVESVSEEVDFVVDLVIEHALSYPDRSLAVVTLNESHAQRLRQGVSSAVANSRAVTEFFDPHRPEAFTVVDVLGAAGLRRDNVIISLGYGRTPHGRVLHQFGAISEPEGASALVDAIEAARSHLSVVSGFSADDLDPHRLRSGGPRMLYHLLRSADRGSVVSENADVEQAADRLLLDVAERLWRIGVNVVPQYGWSHGIRVPLAVGHTREPDELLVAVVTDDPSYVNEPSLRRRDRHWVERLERRGWVVCRVFSSAVFLDPQGEAERIKETVDRVYAERQRQAGRGGTRLALPERVTDDFDEPLASVSGDQPADAGRLGGAEAEAASALTYGQSRVEGRGETIVGVTTTGIPRIVVDETRGVRPPITPGQRLSAYGDDELDALALWIAADGLSRTDDEFVEELHRELGLTRHSQHGRSVLGAVIRRHRSVYAIPDVEVESAPGGADALGESADAETDGESGADSRTLMVGGGESVVAGTGGDGNSTPQEDLPAGMVQDSLLDDPALDRAAAEDLPTGGASGSGDEAGGRGRSSKRSRR